MIKDQKKAPQENIFDLVGQNRSSSQNSLHRVPVKPAKGGLNRDSSSKLENI